MADSVERGILEGRLPAGAPLPPVRDLAASLGLSPGTVASAYRALRLRGLLAGRGRGGTHVTPRPPILVSAPGGPPPTTGLRNLYDGNPDPALLPSLRPHLKKALRGPRLYGAPAQSPVLAAAARRHFAADGIPAGSLAVLGGALDAIERVLQAHLRPGDRIAVEDPGYTDVLDLLGALGLAPEAVPVDECGLIPEALVRVLAAGARAVLITPRAQNPTGAALDARRAAALRKVLDRRPDVLVIEDDHAGPVAGTEAHTLCARRARWGVVRSVSKSLGPDFRLAVLAGDPVTVARVEGRQALGAGWVSHMIQEVVAGLWSDAATARALRGAAETYTARRQALLDALAAEGIAAEGRSGLNVWIPVAQEAETVTALAAAGWAVRAGERYRLLSPPAIRVTIATLRPEAARKLARDLAAVLRPRGPRSAA